MKLKSDLIELHVIKIINNEMLFLLLKRSAHKIYPGLWQMVSGHIKQGETAARTALRELQEETGLQPSRFWVAPNVNSFYSPDEDSISFIPVFVAQVNNDNVLISDEHSEFKWVNSEEAKTFLAWEGQRRSVDIIKEYITNQMSFLKFTEIPL
jgi:dihydroneopterin triphosphate diphosphatase